MLPESSKHPHLLPKPPLLVLKTDADSFRLGSDSFWFAPDFFRISLNSSHIGFDAQNIPRKVINRFEPLAKIDLDAFRIEFDIQRVQSDFFCFGVDSIQHFEGVNVLGALQRSNGIFHPCVRVWISNREGMARQSISVMKLVELEASLREAEDEQANIQRLCNRVAKAMTEAAFKEFPALKKMKAEQIRDFGDIVSRFSTSFALRASDIAFAAEQEK